MRTFIAITKALSDETRVRAMLSLRDGELCLCQIVELLALSPSTISEPIRKQDPQELCACHRS